MSSKKANSMNELKQEAPSPSSEKKTSQFTHAGTIQDPSLKQLRDQIKKVMIPLLIRTFQLKLEMSQALSLPSRLQSNKREVASEEITSQLKQLSQDLNLLISWCQSCHRQIEKALYPSEEEQKTAITPPLENIPNPAIARSFSNALPNCPSPSPSSWERLEPPPPTQNLSIPAKKWWRLWKNR